MPLCARAMPCYARCCRHAQHAATRSVFRRLFFLSFAAASLIFSYRLRRHAAAFTAAAIVFAAIIAIVYARPGFQPPCRG
jgi:hypothetical protein